MMSETSTTTPLIPTLSLNPFIGPFEETTKSVNEEYEKITTALFKEHTEIPTTTPTTVKSEDSTELPKIDEFSEPKVSSTTEKQEVEIKNDLKIEEMIKTIEELLVPEATINVTTAAPVKARELDLSEIPRALAQTPQRPAILSNSQEIVKTTPNELSSILTTLRDILVKVESLTTTKADELSMTTTKFDDDINERKLLKRSIIEEEEIKQKYSTVKGCPFDGGFYKIGEEITTAEEECLECICEYSPIAHCTLKEECLLA